MIFRKRPHGTTIPVSPEPVHTPLAWDEKTVEWLADSDSFDVFVTQSSHRIEFGIRRENRDPRGPIGVPTGFEVEGTLAYSKYIIVTIGFSRQHEQFGYWFYQRLDRQEEWPRSEKKVRLPLIEILLSDSDLSAAKAIHDTHRDALLCGHSHSVVRFFKKKGDGVMTEFVKQHAYSSESQSRYPILGMIEWSE